MKLIKGKAGGNDAGRYCLACGGLLIRYRSPKNKLEHYEDFINRKYCNTQCARMGYKMPRKDKVVREAYYCRSRALCPHGNCVECGKQGDHVHHKDFDKTNNQIENLERLCIPCHMEKHGIKYGCLIKGCNKKHYAKGCCTTHYARLIKYPKERERRLAKIELH